MDRTITCTSGLPAFARLALIVQGLFLIAVMLRPGLFSGVPWFYALIVGYVRPDTPDLVKYFLTEFGALVAFVGLFGRLSVWSIDSQGLTCRTSSFWGGRSIRYAFSDISAVTLRDIQQRQGSSYREYIYIRLKSGKKLSFEVEGSWSDAWAVKRQIEEAMGVIPE